MAATPVFMLSDFGYSDTYAAQMKAAVLSFAGWETPVHDLTHSVPRGNILAGAFHLRTSLLKLPAGSVTVAVVDPGVGSSRAGLAALWQGRFIVAPDNGLVSLLEGELTSWHLPEPDPASSNTFHGRDLFAPCAARIAVDPTWVYSLSRLNTPVKLEIPGLVRKEGMLQVPVLHTDHFGNCILGLDAEQAAEMHFRELHTGDHRFPLERVRCYQEAQHGGSPVILEGSQGFMELAVNGGAAAEVLGLAPGDSVGIIVSAETEGKKAK